MSNSSNADGAGSSASSEICELNRHAGTAVTVSDDTVLLISRAVDAWRLTGGSFDPTVLGSMLRAGYDRSYEQLGPSPPAGHNLLGISVADILIDGNDIQLAAGTGFDPGGIGKGLAADIVCREMRQAGADGVCVNLGGDVRVSGTSPDGPAWTIGVEHPWSERPIALVKPPTARSPRRRRWPGGGRPAVRRGTTSSTRRQDSRPTLI